MPGSDVAKGTIAEAPWARSEKERGLGGKHRGQQQGVHHAKSVGGHADFMNNRKGGPPSPVCEPCSVQYTRPLGATSHSAGLLSKAAGAGPSSRPA